MATRTIEGRAITAEEDPDMKLVAFAFEVLEELVDPIEGLVTLPEQLLYLWKAT